MPNTIQAICPCCGKTANSKQEIDSLFGWRTTSKEISQSYCRKCRAAHCEAGKPCKAKQNYYCSLTPPAVPHTPSNPLCTPRTCPRG
jgi:hypothetical protein